MHTTRGTVVSSKHKGTSVNGNPTISVLLEDSDGGLAWYTTQTDSMIGYGIENPEYKERPHTFELSKAGRIRRDIKEED